MAPICPGPRRCHRLLPAFQSRVDNETTAAVPRSLHTRGEMAKGALSSAGRTRNTRLTSCCPGRQRREGVKARVCQAGGQVNPFSVETDTNCIVVCIETDTNSIWSVSRRTQTVL